MSGPTEKYVLYSKHCSGFRLAACVHRDKLETLNEFGGVLLYVHICEHLSSVMLSFMNIVYCMVYVSVSILVTAMNSGVY